ncbi:MAG: CDP-diacylglycerol--serine O-phosphatidyltransferase [Proteobacteria bacterium]|nr:CDP-diacylglycerol--serine O-phosphatidyltransferase [Pseudomonadota bacterium]
MSLSPVPTEPGEVGVEKGRGSRRRRRRRRDRRAGGRGLSAMLPNLLTTGNLAGGFYAIIKASQGDYDRACIALIFAGICDLLDGRVARLARSTSRFGSEYDSIADTVSFGVAPAILAFNAGAFYELGWTGWVMAFMYTACAALRLARFNVSPGRYRGRFEGLSSPTAAGMVLATVWFVVFLRESGISLGLPASIGAIGIAGLGLLMVSSIPYRSFKEVHLPGSYRSVVLTVIAFAVILSKPSVTLFLVGLVYVSSGPIEWIWRVRTGHALEEIESPEPQASTGEEKQGPPS